MFAGVLHLHMRADGSARSESSESVRHGIALSCSQLLSHRDVTMSSASAAASASGSFRTLREENDNEVSDFIKEVQAKGPVDWQHGLLCFMLGQVLAEVHSSAVCHRQSNFSPCFGSAGPCFSNASSPCFPMSVSVSVLISINCALADLSHSYP